MVKTESGFQPYVVKLYSTDQIENRNSVAAEVVGNLLAPNFDFNVPKMALIDFPNKFINTLPAEELFQFEQSDERLKFGCYYLEDAVNFSKEVQKKYLISSMQLDTLYAFDNFIRNGDRGTKKPNLLFKKGESWLIDHEYALDIKEDTLNKMKNYSWEDKFASHHICLPYLKKESKTNKISLFNSFTEYLRTLNLKEIQDVLIELEGHEFNTQSALIMDYFTVVKRNSAIFVNNLKGFIQ
ncbi:hypothetical protein GCM10011506_19880 [Marivirga lumbricoides]|uniref:HipA-like kinase domain-containing protein n=2 Tax=Marivirga lumbricoides TaxID=1046115 RepID=A0ABQ1M3G6_9BACT|nr:hypothetical protein GCM10011506_19880 [Marivirga lumbricoides]